MVRSFQWRRQVKQAYSTGKAAFGSAALSKWEEYDIRKVHRVVDKVFSDIA